MTKKRKTRTVDKSEYRDFLAKADDFASMLDLALAEGNGTQPGFRLSMP